MGTLLRAALSVLRVTWHLFAILCILAGAVADGPGLLDATVSTGIIGILQTMFQQAAEAIRHEPLGFIAMVGMTMLASIHVRPLLRRVMKRPKPREGNE